MAKLLSIRLNNLPPSVNHLYKVAPFRPSAASPMRVGTRVYMTAEAKTWQTYVTAQFLMNRNKRSTPYSKPVAVKVEFITPDRRRWDIDNRLKSLLDCLMKGRVIDDDSQIYRLEMQRVVKPECEKQTHIIVTTL